jgi:hypothetical protein
MIGTGDDLTDINIVAGCDYTCAGRTDLLMERNVDFGKIRQPNGREYVRIFVVFGMDPSAKSENICQKIASQNIRIL